MPIASLSPFSIATSTASFANAKSVSLSLFNKKLSRFFKEILAVKVPLQIYVNYFA